MAIKTVEQINAFNQMLVKQGGDLVFNDSFPAQEIESSFGEEARMSQVIQPEGYKPFTISIFDIEKNVDIVSLKMIVNPTDIQVGQTYVINQSYTRNGWIPQMWGKQPGTISASGVCASFFLSTTGLTNYNRKDSIGFINIQTLMAMFKNSGADYMITGGNTENTIFKTGYSRVPNVVDALKLSYDGTDYLGTFNTFTLNEEAAKPYNLSYTFEFLYTGLLGDVIEGHIRTEKYVNTEPKIYIQGSDNKFVENIILNTEQINQLFAQNAKKIEEYQMDLTKNYASGGTGNYGENAWNMKRKVENTKQYVPLMDTALKNNKYGNYASLELFRAMVSVESGGVADARAYYNKYTGEVSTATGLCQVIDGTARSLGYTPEDMLNPATALQCGADYLNKMIKYQGGNEALGLLSYKAGPGAVNKFLAQHPEITRENATYENLYPLLSKEDQDYFDAIAGARKSIREEGSSTGRSH